MSKNQPSTISVQPTWIVFAFLLTAVAAWVGSTNVGLGQVPFGFGGDNSVFLDNVGGVTIDANGVLKDIAREARAEAKRNPRQLIGEVPQGMEGKAELRKFSLRELQKAIHEVRQQQGLGRLPQEMTYMGGLQRIQYVFVYPEENDVVLAGPAEGWRMDELGNVVGVTTGEPVMHLTDFLAALRVAFSPGGNVMSCSIDPTPQGVQRMRQLAANLPPVRNADAVADKLEQALGMQRITFRGIDPGSSFAWTLAAADYRMKRLAMGFEEAPVRGMPSFLDMVGSRPPQNMMPRWWMEADYEALLTDGNGLAWELRGQGVKCMTEDEVVNADGTRRGTGQTDLRAKKWADTMTDKYEELASKMAIFGRLRNCMDAAVITTLIASENLHEKAGLDLGVLLDPGAHSLQKVAAPEQVPSQVSYRKNRSSLVLTISGGVSINPWKFVRNPQRDATLTSDRDSATPPGGSKWWWN